MLNKSQQNGPFVKTSHFFVFWTYLFAEKAVRCFQSPIFASTKLMEMLYTLLLTLLIVAICLLLLGVKILLVKGGRFPNTHVSGNAALRKKGVTCVQSQDREAQLSARRSVSVDSATGNDENTNN
jgi:hypothetical protein